MRIGFDAKRAFHNRTGLGNYSRWVLEGLSQRFPEATLLAFNPKKGEAWRQPPEALRECLPQGMCALWPNLWRSGGLVRDLKQEDVALYHGLSNELPAGLPKNIGSVVSIHDLIFERFPQWYKPIDRFTYGVKFRSAARRAHRVLALSEQTRRDLIEFYGIDPERIELHYQSCQADFQVEPERIESAQLKAVERCREWGYPSDFVLSVGTVEPRKNLITLLKALEPLGLPLVVVGAGGGYRKECQDWAAKAGMASRVHWFDRLPPGHLPELYRAAMMLVYPSYFEGFGIPILEALFSGCPVVTSSGGVFPETGGPGSVYVDPGSVDSVRAAVGSVAEDAARRAQMRSAGLRHAWEHFEPKALLNGLFSTYRAVVEEA
ncbi:glycosyltransferase [bacterium]|nr:glycosyltransferase [bacterium]